jgi:mRNA interferase MazF
MAYNRGEVVLVPFPFVDLKSTKARPAMVINDPAYEASSGNLILVMITSQAKKFVSDYALVDWAVAGLKKPSVVRIKIATISTTLVLLKVGQIAPNDLPHIEAQIRGVLNL